MKLIIAGTRTITGWEKVLYALDRSPWRLSDIDTIITGGAKGIDTYAEWVAKQLEIPTLTYDPTDPNSETQYLREEYGKSAYAMRNEEMAKEGDALLAIWDGESRGTEIMINKAIEESIDFYVTVV